MAAAVDPHEEGIVFCFFFTLFFHKFFSRWWIRTSCLVVCRYHHMAAAVDLHEDSSDFADMKMKTCQGLARRHALKRPPFPDTTSEVLASDGQHRSS